MMPVQDHPAGDRQGSFTGGGRCAFCVWAPAPDVIELHLLSPDRLVPLARDEAGYARTTVEGIGAGSLYWYRLDGTDLPDPASRSQPHGVHGPSQVVDPTFPWTDQGWAGLALPDYLMYEVHVGTFTDGGTFDDVVPHLDDLAELGVTAVELMPVAQFPGTRNWGYDGVFPYAAQESYGGPAGLRRFVDACHRRGLAVVLDVVHNHLGPEGNVLAAYGPYFTDRYRTPWGDALNFDGPHSDEVRALFIDSALCWVTDCHIDALRLDAVHAIVDHSARTFLDALAEAVHTRGAALRRRIYLIAETTLNDSRLVRPRAAGGTGIDAQWNDDFHHALHTALLDERGGYYQDYAGIPDLVRAFPGAYVYTGQFSAFRQRSHGNSSAGVPPDRFVVFAQNHDQIGNRSRGDRLADLLPFEALKLAAGCVLLSPCIPLLFMGEEYGERAPFPYFVSHTDPALVDAVRRGRRGEFAAFAWEGDPPDPQAEATFRRARLNHHLKDEEGHRTLRQFYRELIRLRHAITPRGGPPPRAQAQDRDGVLVVDRTAGAGKLTILYNFHPRPAEFAVPAHRPWRRLLDSSDAAWGGPGAAVPADVRAGAMVMLNPYACVVLVEP
ncbi:MAG TPA: malto-oligosyltrehalose trehalohydrolase [bacterium]